MTTLNENQIKMINMTVEGKTVSEIARSLSLSRQCIYNWMKLDVVKLELDRCKLEKDDIKRELPSYIENMKKLSKSTNENIALEANRFLLNLAYR